MKRKIHIHNTQINKGRNTKTDRQKTISTDNLNTTINHKNTHKIKYHEITPNKADANDTKKVQTKQLENTHTHPHEHNHKESKGSITTHKCICVKNT